MNVKAAIGWTEGWPGASLPICYGPAMSEVETARLLLRRWQDDDLERLVSLYSDQRVARFLSVDGRPWPPWGQGLATEGARAALGYGFEVVGLERIISTARTDNAASRRVMETCGLAFHEEFTYKGVLVDLA